MGKKLVILIAFFILITIGTFTNKSVLAANIELNPYTLRVSPDIINITLEPGKQYTYQVTVENLLNTPLPLRATLEDFQSDDEEGGYSLGQPTTNSPLLKWISLNKHDFIVPANSTQVINLTIKLPHSIPVGGYYGLLFFQPVLSSQEKNIPLTTKVGVLLLANIGVPSENETKGSITSFSSDKWLYDKGPLSLDFQFKNTILNFYSAKPIVTVQPFLGKPQQFVLEEKFVFPGKNRHWNQSLDLQDYWHGIYKATLSISVGNGQRILKSIYFFAFPYQLAIFVMLFIFLTVWIIKNPDRVVRAVRVLIKQ